MGFLITFFLIIAVFRASALSSAVSTLANTGMSFSRMDEKEKQQALEEEQVRLQALKVRFNKFYIPRFFLTGSNSLWRGSLQGHSVFYVSNVSCVRHTLCFDQCCKNAVNILRSSEGCKSEMNLNKGVTFLCYCWVVHCHTDFWTSELNHEEILKVGRWFFLSEGPLSCFSEWLWREPVAWLEVIYL